MKFLFEVKILQDVILIRLHEERFCLRKKDFRLRIFLFRLREICVGLLNPQLYFFNVILSKAKDLIAYWNFIAELHCNYFKSREYEVYENMNQGRCYFL